MTCRSGRLLHVHTNFSTDMVVAAVVELYTACSKCLVVKTHSLHAELGSSYMYIDPSRVFC